MLVTGKTTVVIDVAPGVATPKGLPIPAQPAIALLDLADEAKANIAEFLTCSEQFELIGAEVACGDDEDEDWEDIPLNV